jgi:thioredoxin-related protein
MLYSKIIKMKKFVLLLIILFTTFVYAKNPISVLEKAEQKAKTEHKMILLKFSGSDWCIPCIKLQKEVLNTQEFKSFADENLVLINADFPRLKKNKPTADVQQTNDELAEKFNKDGIFPRLFLINADGKVIEHWEGFDRMDTRELIRIIQDYIWKADAEKKG